MRVAKAVLAICSLVVVSGCVTTAMQGYADRDLPTKRIQSIVAYVSAPTTMSSQVQAAIGEEARKRNVITQDAFVLFPPTRSYSNTEIQQGLTRDRVDAILSVQIGDSGVIRQYAGTYFSSQTTGDFSASGTATRMGNLTNIELQGTSNSTTSGMATPVYRHSRQTDFVARLIDPTTGRNLWSAEAKFKQTDVSLLARVPAYQVLLQQYSMT